jgi:hypothetical protein
MNTHEAGHFAASESLSGPVGRPDLKLFAQNIEGLFVRSGMQTKVCHPSLKWLIVFCSQLLWVIIFLSPLYF